LPVGAILQARARLEAERTSRGGIPEGACCQDRRIQLEFKPAQGVFLSGPPGPQEPPYFNEMSQ